MKNGNVNEFVSNLDFEHQAVIFDGHKLFFEGVIFDEEEASEKKYVFDIYQYSMNEVFEKKFYSIKCKSSEECIKTFLEAPIFNGKKFWDIEAELTWIDDF